MAQTTMIMVFAYDVRTDRRRRRIAGMLERIGVRVQRSVFEVVMKPPDADALGMRIAAELGEADSLRVYAVDAHGYRRTRTYGVTPMVTRGDYHVF